MKTKNIVILLSITAVIIISIFIFLKKEKREQQSQQNNMNAIQNEKKVEKEIIDKEKYKVQEFKQKKSNLKILYEEKGFKNVLMNASQQKVPSETQWYFAENILAIDKNHFNNLMKEVLWEDENFYYVSSKSDKIHNSPEHFNPNYSLVVYDKNTSTVGVINGYFIIVLNDNITDKKRFENQYDIQIISSYPKDRILVARAVKNSNIMNTFKNLKAHLKVKNINIEIITQFPKAE